jgi:hypothetical protein
MYRRCNSRRLGRLTSSASIRATYSPRAICSPLFNVAIRPRLHPFSMTRILPQYALDGLSEIALAVVDGHQYGQFGHTVTLGDSLPVPDAHRVPRSRRARKPVGKRRTRIERHS